MKRFFFLPAFIFLAKILCGQAFTKVTTGPLVNTPGDSRSVNWLDVNNDGLVDCMITNGLSGGQNNMLYINAGAGNFTAVTGDPLVMDGKPSDGATWADTDNDGDLDCFVANWYNINNLFYANDGNGNFTQLTSGNFVNDGGYSETASWGDFNADGQVDLYVCNSAGTKQNFLYKNLGANTFSKITTGAMVTDAFESRSVNWTDLDLDGDLDLFIANESNGHENIYRNDGAGAFTKITAGPLVNNAGNTMSGSWADFDNDGDLDVFLANDQGSNLILQTNALFRNEGNFNFTKLVADTVSKTPGTSFSSAWSDVDNDGDLDLFVTNAFKQNTKLVNYFYLNNGNGGFTRVNNALTADSSWTYGCAFADYDNDGFEDLAVATCRFGGVDINDFLYHNNGNSNGWITIKLIGISSNKAAIGTKIRLKATINGSSVWQLREVSAQSAYCSQNDLRVHFGLGNATIIDSLKIEWPSGINQYSVSLSPNQFLSIVESATLTTSIKNESNRLGIKIFPNPSDRIFMIKNEEGFKPGDKIQIADIAGRVLTHLVIKESSSQYDLDFVKLGYSAGHYLLTIFSGSKSFTQKLILTHE